MRKIQTSLLIILFTMCQLSMASNKDELLDDVVAVVNQQVITESQVKNEMADIQTLMEMQRLQNPSADIKPLSNKELRKQAIERLIKRSMQMQYAKKVKIDINDKMVDEAITVIASQNNMDLATFTQMLEQQGMTLNEYRKKIHQQLVERELKQKVIAPQVKISDAEIQAGLRDPNNPMNSRLRYLVHDYLIELDDDADNKMVSQAQATANKVLNKMKKGHQPSYQEAEMIDLGWRQLHELPPVFAKLVKNMRKGETHLPIQTANGFHVLHLADVEEPYQNHKAHEFKLRHILMKPTALLTDNLVKDKLNDIIKETQKGTEFSKLARKYSEDYDTAHKGGDMGWLKRREFPPSFVGPVSTIREGQVSQPFKTDAGWHIVYLEKVREKEDANAMREQETKNWLFQQKIAEESEAWLAKLRENTYIQMEKETA